MSEFHVPDHMPEDWCYGERDFEFVRGVATPVLTDVELELVKELFARPIEIEGTDHERTDQ